MLESQYQFACGNDLSFSHAMSYHIEDESMRETCIQNNTVENLFALDFIQLWALFFLIFHGTMNHEVDVDFIDMIEVGSGRFHKFYY